MRRAQHLRELRAEPLRRLPADPSTSSTVFAARMQSLRTARSASSARQVLGLVAFGFLVFTILSICLVQWKVASVPVRGLFGLGFLGLLAGFQPAACAVALHKQRNTLLLVAAFAVLGAVVSILARAEPLVVLRQISEIHLQAAVNLLVAATVLEICGAGTLVRCFLGVVGVSMALAVLQAAGIEPAWTIREALGSLLDTGEYGRSRAAGLSMNPVLLGSQTCLAIAMLYMFCRYSGPEANSRKDFAILGLSAAVLVVALASGTRSPMLGVIIFLAVYSTRRFGAWALVAGMVAVAATPLMLSLLDHLQGSGVRALQTEDKSAIGRWPLLVYGWRLFIDDPLGYGLGFDPTQHWAKHWSALSHLRNAVVIRELALHNYPLNTLNKYGAGILLLIPVAAALMWRHRLILLGFIPYVFHIFFHNDGPLDADYMIWFVIALTSMRLSSTDMSSRPKRRLFA